MISMHLIQDQKASSNEASKEYLRDNGRIICWGVGGKRGKKYRCGTEVDDPEIIGKVKELISEAEKKN
ncbi:hypothetical protein [Vulcanisaeta sp. JCM 16161]|uniref:hypothetical protein n=1 Tax=Vulcanisaeta sp. JCM 16161 TaxID=1295372 RepID=UPI000A806838|nr:hypothetical protein [Vulcanisaeta sp. JCM 16161]